MSARKMPRQKPGTSKQDYRTPQVFLDAVVERFGALAFDLAATKGEQIKGVGRNFFSPEQDALEQDWTQLVGNLWLNPPFSRIEPWALKCADLADRKAWTLLLVPASVGSGWFRRNVLGSGYVMFLAPRISFDGDAPYPKDLMLVAYGFGAVGSEAWVWQ